MRVLNSPPVHLTYCLNIHPGESLEDIVSAIRNKASAVQTLVKHDGPFGLGLRLSNEASLEACNPDRLTELKQLLADHGMYVFTINGFPYGPFHGESVQENVYRPDWREQERLDYTNRLADILAELLPSDCIGSISTVPGSYGEWIKSDEDLDSMKNNLRSCADYLAAIRQRTGKDICLALEPEPDCYIERTDQAIAFFNALTDIPEPEYAKRHIGICFDTCHMALQFEDLQLSLASLHNADIRIPKLQLSSALHIEAPGPIRELKKFCDPVYLHQVKVLADDEDLMSFPNLTDDLIEKLSGCEYVDIRCHFHVPLYFEEKNGIRSTSDLLNWEFLALAHKIGIPHFEIETYTFDVLPDDIRPDDVTESIAREYQWVLDVLNSA